MGRGPTRTAADRAVEALAIADRKVKKVDQQIADAEQLLVNLRSQRESLTATRDYRAADPALPREDKDDGTPIGDPDAEYGEGWTPGEDGPLPDLPDDAYPPDAEALPEPVSAPAQKRGRRG